MIMKAAPPVEWIKNPRARRGGGGGESTRIIPPGIAREARKFHRQIPGFRVSPLKGLNNLAELLGLGGIWVKDESQRLALNSFKVLGGSFAIYSYLKRRLGAEGGELSFSELVSPEVRRRLGTIVFTAATDGNHGRGVAWAASKLGMKSVIYVHRATSPSRIRAIEDYGAEVRIVDGTYDEAVRQAGKDAEKNGWQMIEDTSWEGYEDIPTWVMRGYTTIFAEAQEELSGQGIVRPSHIFVQAGVGALAGSMIGFYQGLFGKEAPVSVVVEPARASCVFESAKSDDGLPHPFPGELRTFMAGLACGEPSPLAWKILREGTDYFARCPDYVAAKGMRIYAVPVAGDPFIVSGESGAVTLGILEFIMNSPELRPFRAELDLGPDSQVLLINTEGNTDPYEFRRVVWEGLESVPDLYRYHSPDETSGALRKPNDENGRGSQPGENPCR